MIPHSMDFHIDSPFLYAESNDETQVADKGFLFFLFPLDLEAPQRNPFFECETALFCHMNLPLNTRRQGER